MTADDANKIEWFDGPDDARHYLLQLGRLWLVVVLWMSGLLARSTIVVIAFGLGLVVVAAVLTRPLQHRAKVLVPQDEDGPPLPRGRPRGGERDRVFRQLAYGDEPLRVALRLVGWNPILFYLRYVVMALLLSALAFVLLGAGGNLGT